LIVDDNTMEIVYEHAIQFLEKRACDCIVVDSLPALVSIREEEGSMEDLQPGQAAFLTGKFFRKSTPAIKRSLMSEERVCLGLVINQWREKIGVQHGDPRTTPGGLGKNFYYFIRAEVRRTEWITNSRDKKIGQEITLRNVKNKTAPPGAKGVVDYYFDGPRAGEFDTLKEIVNLSIDMGVVERKGAWISFGDDRWNGREAFIDAVREDDDLAKVLSKDVLARVHEPVDLAVADEDDEDEDEPPRKKAPKKAAVPEAPAPKARTVPRKKQ
jgi:recombination protein RecA